jgi:outer membrane murein-binding lipoprotein Lpp
MYAPPESNVILFPANPVGRMRLQLQELQGQLRQLEADVAAFTEHFETGRRGPVPGLGTASIRLAYIRDLIDAIEPSALPSAAYFGAIVALGSARASARRKLTELSSSMGSLRDQSQARAERVRVLRSVIAATREQARAFAEVERDLAPSQ